MTSRTPDTSFRSAPFPVSLALASLLGGCASSPGDIAAAYVSPLAYRDYDCEQIALELEHVGRRTRRLYQSLQKEANADAWQMGIGLVLFWPALFFLEGGDGPEAQEYAELKGEFAALQDVSVQKKCGIDAPSPEAIIQAESEREAAGTALDGR